MTAPERSGIEQLRHAVHLFDACREDFNDRFTAELLKLAAAQSASEWDYLPDTWSPAQVRAAIKRGTPPTFSDGDEEPST